MVVISVSPQTPKLPKLPNSIILIHKISTVFPRAPGSAGAELQA